MNSLEKQAASLAPIRPAAEQAKRRALEQWSKNPCGAHVARGLEFGTRGYFDAIEDYRYRIYAPWMKKVIGFDRYEHKRVLEVGCGTGTDLLQFARGGAVVTGCDLTPRSVEIARRRFKVYGLEGQFSISDAENLSFPDESFDLVYSFGVIHHTPDTQRAVSEIHRVLRPGGKAVVMVYHRSSFYYWLGLMLKRGIFGGELFKYGPAEIMSRYVEHTETGGRPLVKAFTRGESYELFKDFGRCAVEVNQLTRPELGVVGKKLPEPLFTWLAVRFGWNLIITAEKSLPSSTHQISTQADSRARAASRKGVAALLDLSGNKDAAERWASDQIKDKEIVLLNKADLKWGSKREALARIRELAPDTFAVFTSDLNAQSARGSIIMFAALAGARRILLGDCAGRKISRRRAGAFALEAPRLALELILGYGLLVPLSWLLTVMLGALLGYRKMTRESASPPRTFRDGEPQAVLYLRGTLSASTLTGAASAGGMASHVAGFTRGALALGHQLKFVTVGDVGIENPGVEVNIIPLSPEISATRVLFELWNNLVFTVRALGYIRDRGDTGETAFIYQRYSRFNWTGVVLSMMTGLPLLLEYNGSELWLGRHWDPIDQLWLLERFERLNHRAADLIFVVSEVERRNLIEAGVEPARVITNPNGVDADEFYPGCGGREIRRELGIDDRVVVGFLGTFGPWHGAPVLAEAATRVAEPANCHFLFIGDGDQRAMTEARLEDAGKSQTATFTGRIEHKSVRAYLDACDILVSPHVESEDGSEFFGSPTKLFEYMAMARPIVASRLGQIADVIGDEQTGILVAPGDPDALARSIERLAADAHLRERLGKNARQKVIERYTWRHNAERVFKKGLKV